MSFMNMIGCLCIDETYEKKDGAGSEGESLEALRWDGGELLKVLHNYSMLEEYSLPEVPFY